LADKIRVHNLAKELNVTSKAILQKCKAEGIPLKNHMSTLSAGLEATVREWFSEGAHSTVVETAGRIDLDKAHSEVKKQRRRRRSTSKAEGGVAVAEQERPQPSVRNARAQPGIKETTDEQAPETVEPAATETPEVGADKTDVGEVSPPVESESAKDIAAESAEPIKSAETPATQEPAVTEQAGEESEPEPELEDIEPAGPQNVPTPAKLSGPRVVRYEAPESHGLPPRRGRRTRPADRDEPPGAMPPVMPPPSGKPSRKSRRGEQDSDRGGKRGVRRRQLGGDEGRERIREWNNQDLAERQARLRGATGRRMSARRAAERTRPGAPSTATPITEAEVHEPIMVKDLCAAIGIPFQRLFPVLSSEHNLMLGTNSVLQKDVAELLALHFGVELTVIPAKTKLDELNDQFAGLERKNLKTRPPIVAVLGHVDHGKTSLLDAIRRSRVANKEDGGITQHISSYQFKRDDVVVTFLDTPGHEAFTALRARGAQLTDVVVLVVAADDGVMPQTVEAINHAKAANVPIVVALNKIDLGTQNIQKIYGQLTEHGLTPSGDWGGDVDVIHTSATTETGINEMLAHLSAMAEIYEFKADPTIPATGTVVEAESRRGVGAVLQVIVREGTLSVGDVLVCGNSYGKVRAIVDDTGKKLRKAGPSMPVEVWGMSEVPEAGDHFYRVQSMAKAKEIAEEVAQQRQEKSRAVVTKARSLEDLLKQRDTADIPELNVIIKGDVDGSVSALADTLKQFPADQVKLNILHSGVGVVTDSDVHLANASNAIIIAFRVATSPQTRRIADRDGVDIRTYKVIYDVTDDIKQAMEGLLAPEEVLEARGSLEVREVFSISKVGRVAGCYVTDGTVAADHVATITRDGAIIREKCKLASLRRFKNDVREVRSGMECGLRLAGFDDLKVGDIIETFEQIEVARTLETTSA